MTQPIDPKKTFRCSLESIYNEAEFVDFEATSPVEAAKLLVENGIEEDEYHSGDEIVVYVDTGEGTPSTRIVFSLMMHAYVLSQGPA